MIVNNIIAFLIHLGCFLILVVIVSIFPYTFEENKPNMISILHCIFTYIVFILSGYMLKQQKTAMKNWLSVAAFGIIGFFLALVNFLINYSSQILFLLWLATALTTANLLMLIGHPNKYIIRLLCLIIPFVPSLFFWLGLEWKRKVLAKTKHDLASK